MTNERDKQQEMAEVIIIIPRVEIRNRNWLVTMLWVSYL